MNRSTRRMVVLWSLSAAVSTWAADTLDLKVMTFNIRGAFVGFDPIDNWLFINVQNPSNPLAGPHRRDRAIRTIQSDEPDLMGVQELKEGQRDDLLAAFSDFRYVGRGREAGFVGDSNGIFYRASRFDLLENGDFWLSATPSIAGTTFVGNGTDTGNPRMATWAKFLDRFNDQTYFVLNTHWSLDSLARRQSAQLIQSQLSTLAGDLPILVMGDLNATASSTEYRTLRDLTTTTGVDLGDAFSAAGGVDGRTFHNYSGGISGSRIDHILYEAGPGSPFVPVSASILRNTYDGGLYPSDHYPVAVTFHVPIPEARSWVLLSTVAGVLIVGGWRSTRAAKRSPETNS